jgi:putative acetyltransferase
MNNSQNNSQFIILRPARQQDSESIFKVFYDSVKVLNREHYTPDQIQALLDHKMPYARNSGAWGRVVYVAVVNNTIAGFAALQGTMINAVFVRPRFIRQGIGRQLLNVLEDEARSRKIRKLSVISSMTGKPFYEACGYHCQHDVHLSLNAEIGVDCVQMEKTLIEVEQSQDEGLFSAFCKTVEWILSGQ